MTASPFQKKKPPMMGPGPVGPIEGRPAPPRQAKPPVEAPPPEPEPEMPAGNGVTLQMLGYRGPEMQCQGCSHFDGNAACDLDPTTPVVPDGGCQAFAVGGEREGPTEEVAEGGQEEEYPA